MLEVRNSAAACNDRRRTKAAGLKRRPPIPIPNFLSESLREKRKHRTFGGCAAGASQMAFQPGGGGAGVRRRHRVRAADGADAGEDLVARVLLSGP